VSSTTAPLRNWTCLGGSDDRDAPRAVDHRFSAVDKWNLCQNSPHAAAMSIYYAAECEDYIFTVQFYEVFRGLQTDCGIFTPDEAER
jgi:hypothetical protein